MGVGILKKNFCRKKEILWRSTGAAGNTGSINFSCLFVVHKHTIRRRRLKSKIIKSLRHHFWTCSLHRHSAWCQSKYDAIQLTPPRPTLTWRTHADANYYANEDLCEAQTQLPPAVLSIHLLHIILVIKWNDFVSRKNSPVSIIEQKVGAKKSWRNEQDITSECFHLIFSKLSGIAEMVFVRVLYLNCWNPKRFMKEIADDPFDGCKFRFDVWQRPIRLPFRHFGIV